jgi:hypothetical protein
MQKGFTFAQSWWHTPLKPEAGRKKKKKKKILHFSSTPNHHLEDLEFHMNFRKARSDHSIKRRTGTGGLINDQSVT